MVAIALEASLERKSGSTGVPGAGAAVSGIRAAAGGGPPAVFARFAAPPAGDAAARLPPAAEQQAAAEAAAAATAAALAWPDSSWLEYWPITRACSSAVQGTPGFCTASCAAYACVCAITVACCSSVS